MHAPQQKQQDLQADHLAPAFFVRKMLRRVLSLRPNKAGFFVKLMLRSIKMSLLDLRPLR
tara:strand:- start:1401 stop:1580 length:180 start_codon:yes stop_codon:yes gene_type:complete